MLAQINTDVLSLADRLIARYRLTCNRVTLGAAILEFMKQNSGKPLFVIRIENEGQYKGLPWADKRFAEFLIASREAEGDFAVLDLGAPCRVLGYVQNAHALLMETVELKGTWPLQLKVDQGLLINVYNLLRQRMLTHPGDDLVQVIEQLGNVLWPDKPLTCQFCGARYSEQNPCCSAQSDALAARNMRQSA